MTMNSGVYAPTLHATIVPVRNESHCSISFFTLVDTFAMVAWDDVIIDDATTDHLLSPVSLIVPIADTFAFDGVDGNDDDCSSTTEATAIEPTGAC
mmetsp:Transcript_21409/g.59572  ORF Transcript_21409/g.59572 Transcript_21409/m.59572 type:complete len:96 (-) Transcript_21409:561-848(-)